MRLSRLRDALDAALALPADILVGAARPAKPGGRLVDARFPMSAEENEAQVESYLADRPGFGRHRQGRPHIGPSRALRLRNLDLGIVDPPGTTEGAEEVSACLSRRKTTNNPGAPDEV